MKILLFDTTQAYLTPGGKATHALKLHQELKKLGVIVEFARWWDADQKDCDLIHSLSHFDSTILSVARSTGKKLLLSHIMDVQANKSSFEKNIDIISYGIANKLPNIVKSRFAFSNISKFDHFHYMSTCDRDTALRYFPFIDVENTSIIPHGHDPFDILEEEYIKSEYLIPDRRFLISCANIHPRKQSVLLAKIAKEAKIPLVFIGSANINDDYFKKFELEIDNTNTFYYGYVGKDLKDSLLKKASGFALLSLAESGCISVYEATSYKLPLFLSDLPWAHSYEDIKKINYCNYKNLNIAKKQLVAFYRQCGHKKEYPFKVRSWSELASMYADCYEKILMK